MGEMDVWSRTASSLVYCKVLTSTGMFIPWIFLKKILSENVVRQLLYTHFSGNIPGFPFDVVANLMADLNRGLKLFAAIVLAQKPDMMIPLLNESKFDSGRLISEWDLRKALPARAPDLRSPQLGFSNEEVTHLHQELVSLNAHTLHYKLSCKVKRFEQPMPFLHEVRVEGGRLGSFGNVMYVTVCTDYLYPLNEYELVIGSGNIKEGLWLLRDPPGRPIGRVELVRKGVPNGHAAICEKEVLQSVTHACLVPLLFSYEFKDDLYMLFPKYDQPLSEFLDDQRADQWSPYEYITAMAGLSDGLHTLHQYCSKDKSLLYPKIGSHNDLSPNNIMVDLTCKKFIIIDFGFALIRDPSDTSRIQARGDEGGWLYAAPEVIEDPNSKHSLREKDVWALGCIIAEVLIFVGSNRLTRTEFGRQRREKGMKSGPNYFHSFDSTRRRRILHPHVQTLLVVPPSGGYEDTLLERASRYVGNTLLNCLGSRPTAVQIAQEFTSYLKQSKPEQQVTEEPTESVEDNTVHAQVTPVIIPVTSNVQAERVDDTAAMMATRLELQDKHIPKNYAAPSPRYGFADRQWSLTCMSQKLYDKINGWLYDPRATWLHLVADPDTFSAMTLEICAFLVKAAKLQEVALVEVNIREANPPSISAMVKAINEAMLQFCPSSTAVESRGEGPVGILEKVSQKLQKPLHVYFHGVQWIEREENDFEITEVFRVLEEHSRRHLGSKFLVVSEHIGPRKVITPYGQPVVLQSRHKEVEVQNILDDAKRRKLRR